MKIHDQRSTDMQLLADRLQGQRTVMFTMQEAGGHLGSRPLTLQEMDADGALWILVSKQAMTPHFTNGETPANVTVTDSGKSLYVSISGRASLVDDAARKQALWTVMARPWFSGPDDADLTLLCILPLQAEAWDGPESSVLRLLAMAASVAAGKPVGLGHHEVFETAGQSLTQPNNVPARSTSLTPKPTP